MLTQYKQRNLEVRYIDEINDYGVFTNEFIKNGEIVEICYSLKVDKPTIIPLQSFLTTNGFSLFLGYGTLYNHSKTPNMVLEEYDKNHIIFYSLNDIHPNTELSHYFGKRYCDIKEKKDKSLI